METLLFIVAAALLFGGKNESTTTDADHGDQQNKPAGSTPTRSGGSTTQLSVNSRGFSRSYAPQLTLTTQQKKGKYAPQLQGFYSPNAYGKNRLWYLEPKALQALNAATQSWNGLGNFPMMVDAFRNVAQQDQAHRDKPNLAAPSNKSLHTRGLAIDVRAHPGAGFVFDVDDSTTWGDQEAMAQELLSFGWERPTPISEPWHFEYTGG